MWWSRLAVSGSFQSGKVVGCSTPWDTAVVVVGCSSQWGTAAAVGCSSPMSNPAAGDAPTHHQPKPPQGTAAAIPL